MIKKSYQTFFRWGLGLFLLVARRSFWSHQRFSRSWRLQRRNLRGRMSFKFRKVTLCACAWWSLKDGHNCWIWLGWLDFVQACPFVESDDTCRRQGSKQTLVASAGWKFDVTPWASSRMAAGLVACLSKMLSRLKRFSKPSEAFRWHVCRKARIPTLLCSGKHILSWDFAAECPECSHGSHYHVQGGKKVRPAFCESPMCHVFCIMIHSDWWILSLFAWE